MGITSTIVMITNSSIAITIGISNTNATSNDNDCGDSGGVYPRLHFEFLHRAFTIALNQFGDCQDNEMVRCHCRQFR